MNRTISSHPFNKKLNPEYIPIDCATHSEYELAIIRKQSIKLVWIRSKKQLCIETLQPINLRTRWRAEFMIAYNNEGRKRVIRLDRIKRAIINDSMTGLVAQNVD